MVKIFDTLSGAKKSMPETKGRPLRLFVCGPTVHDFPHIGNARTYIVFDAFVKYLRALGKKIFYLQNITDIDDKIITRAWSERTTPKAVAAKYSRAYEKNMKALGITSVDEYAKATDHIPEIIRQVKTLIDKKYAYKIDGDGWYFDISKFSDYGKLAHRTAADAEDAVTRIDDSFAKKNKGDFCLWKFSKPDEPSWPSDLGMGRPGWHIEDTAITAAHFGPQYDMHGGAIDLKFPHHEAEIAQAEAASGKKPLVQIWMHTGFLLVEGKKMSKSLHNFVTIDGFLSRHNAETFRLMALSHHYRSPVNYSDSLAGDYARSWNGVLEFLARLRFVSESQDQKVKSSGSAESALASAEKAFHGALEDDFNTPKALASIFELVGSVEKGIWKLSQKEAQETMHAVERYLAILGFAVRLPKIPGAMLRAAKAREEFRTNKQFFQSDRLRKELEDVGYSIEDTPLGPFVWPRNSH